jgi:hypothetical protein
MQIERTVQCCISLLRAAEAWLCQISQLSKSNLQCMARTSGLYWRKAASVNTTGRRKQGFKVEHNAQLCAEPCLVAEKTWGIIWATHRPINIGWFQRWSNSPKQQDLTAGICVCSTLSCLFEVSQPLFLEASFLPSWVGLAFCQPCGSALTNQITPISHHGVGLGMLMWSGLDQPQYLLGFWHWTNRKSCLLPLTWLILGIGARGPPRLLYPTLKALLRGRRTVSWEGRRLKKH